MPGSAKYGTLPGFCVMADLAGSEDLLIGGTAKTDVSQGEAQIACAALGAGYHLISENEWLTIAENILQVAENDIDKEASGMQLAASSSAFDFKLTNDNIIKNLVGEIAEWTNQNVTAAGEPDAPIMNKWNEYSEVTDYNGLNISPDYYLTDAVNHIGKIYLSSRSGLKGFVRGSGGIYGLDLSYGPSEKSPNIGFRCGK